MSGLAIKPDTERALRDFSKLNETYSAARRAATIWSAVRPVNSAM